MNLKDVYLKTKWHLSWWANYFVLTLLLSRVTSLNSRKYELERWGSPYGGWYVPHKLIKKSWNYYLVGVGDDISFDLRIVERVGSNVHLFDPTPKSIEYMKRFKDNHKIHFHPIGVWIANENVKFKKPIDSSWTSHSIEDLQGTNEEAFVAQCKRLSAIMEKLGHEKIDLLKLDISGAEYAVLEDMFSSNISPNVLLVEFDQPANVIRTFRSIKNILGNGYELAFRDMWDFVFIKSTISDYK